MRGGVLSNNRREHMTKKLPLLLLIVALALMVSCNPDAANDPKENAKASSSGLTRQMVQGENVSGIKLEVTLGEGSRFIKSIRKGEDVTSWFANFPKGVSAKAYAPDMAGNKGLGGKDVDSGDEKPKMDFSGEGITFYAVKEGDTSLTVEFNGTVDDVPEGPMTFTIPAEYTNANVDIVVGVSGGSSGNLPVIKICSITFKHNYGIEDRKVSVRSGEKVEFYKPADREGYTFEGWYTEKDCTKKYDFNTIVKNDIVLWAKWTSNTSEGVKKPIIEVSGTGFGVYTVTITNPNYQTIPYMYYTLDGSYPDPSKYEEEMQVMLSTSEKTIFEVSSGTVINALVSNRRETSDVTEKTVPGKDSFYIIGNESLHVRRFKSSGEIEMDATSARYTKFTPYATRYDEVSESIVVKENEGENYDDFRVIEVFEYSVDKLLVVAEYNTKYCYFFANRSNGEYDGEGVRNIVTLKSKQIIDVLFYKGTKEVVFIAREAIYFANVVDHTTSKKEVTSTGNVYMFTGYVDGDSLYVFGAVGNGDSYLPCVWKVDMTTKNVTEKIVTDNAYFVVDGTMKDGLLYLVMEKSVGSNLYNQNTVNKELWTFDFVKGEAKSVSSVKPPVSRCDQIVVNNILFFGDELVITGGYNNRGQSEIYPQRYFPCIWKGTDWELYDGFHRPNGFEGAQVDRVQIINGGLYFLSNMFESADSGRGNSGQANPITHGVVWKYNDPDFFIEVGSGFYNRGLYTEIAYLSL